MTYIKQRLGEHSTQVILSADFTALLAAISGQLSWQNFALAILGSLPGILMPANTTPAA